MQNKENLKGYFIELPNFLVGLVYPFFIYSASPILLEISKSLEVRLTDFILVFTFISIGYAVGEFTSFLFNLKLKKINIILGSYTILIIVTITLIFIKSIYIFYFLYLIIGYFLGVIFIQAYGNILESKIKNKHMVTSIMLTAFPIGALIAPPISSFIVSRQLNWRIPYFIIIFIMLILFFLFLIVFKINKSGSITKESEKISFKEIFVNRNNNITFVIILILVLFYVFAEKIIVLWFPTFFRIERSFDAQTAGLLLSIYWGGIIFGRTITNFLVTKMKVNYIILMLLLLSVSSIALMTLAKTEFTILLTILLVGIGFSGVYPLLISSGSTVYDKGRSILLTILVTTANTCGAIAPFIVRMASIHSKNLSFLLPIFFLAIIILILSIFMVYRKIISKREVIVS